MAKLVTLNAARGPDLRIYRPQHEIRNLAPYFGTITSVGRGSSHLLHRHHWPLPPASGTGPVQPAAGIAVSVPPIRPAGATRSRTGRPGTYKSAPHRGTLRIAWKSNATASR